MLSNLPLMRELRNHSRRVIIVRGFADLRFSWRSIYILEAVRLGLVPRVTRRLTGHERSTIRPGTVWVWEEGEAL